MPCALYFLALAVFVMGTSEFMLAGLLPDISQDLGVSVGTAGLLTSAFAVGMIVGAPAMAALSRRWPPRTALLTCLAVFALCHVLGATTDSFPILVGTRVVAAIANAGFLSIALSTAAGLVAPNQKGRALAVLLAGTTIATVAGVPAGALVGAGLGWRATFWIVALLCVPASVGILKRIGTRTRPAPSATGRDTSLASEFACLRTAPVLLSMLLAALVNGGTFAVFTFIAPLMTEEANLSRMSVSVGLILFGVGSYIGVVTAGRYSDSHPRILLIAALPALLGGWLALAVLAQHPVPLFVLIFTQGITAFAVGSTLISRILYAAADAPAMSGAYATAALNVGAASGPAIGGVALSHYGSQGPVWVAVGLTAIALATLVLLIELVSPRK